MAGTIDANLRFSLNVLKCKVNQFDDSEYSGVNQRRICKTSVLPSFNEFSIRLSYENTCQMNTFKNMMKLINNVRNRMHVINFLFIVTKNKINPLFSINMVVTCKSKYSNIADFF